MHRRVVYCFSAHQVTEDEPINYNVQHSLDEILPSKYHILYLNVNSLENKLDNLEQYVHRLNEIEDRQIYIIAISKIKICEEATKYYNLPEYNSYFSTNTTGDGGVALLIHKSLTSGIIENYDNNTINCLMANIPALNLNVGVLYKDPSVSTGALTEYYKKILSSNQRAILLGKMNIDLLNPNRSTRQYTDAVTGLSFSLLNKVDREYATCSNSSIVDHILSNVKKFKYSLTLRKERFSDHKVMVLGFDDNKPNKIDFIAEPDDHTYYRINYKKFNQHFSRVDLQQIATVNGLVKKLVACKRKSAQRMQITRQSHDKPWINEPELSRKQRFNMRSLAYAKRINDSKNHWNTITEILTNKLSSRNSIDAILNRTKQIVSDKQQIANIFNEDFLNIGKKLDASIPRMVNCNVPITEFNQNSIERIYTSSGEIKRKIKAMKQNNNFHDSIPSNTLTYLSPKLAPHLARLFNKCFRTGKFPSSLKTDRIVPAFKSNDPLLTENYRPISIPHNLSKIMESIISDRITKFCRKNGIIADDQYGFQKNSSAMSAIVAVVDHLQVELNENRGSVGACLFIDLKKASNTIHHDRFLDKLYRNGIRGNLYRLIRNYLFKRRQYVDIDNFHSEILVNENAFSIPQGSALGPLFFLMYINDIFEMNIYGEIVLYADDICIIYVEDDEDVLANHMQSDLKELNKWFTLNSLTLNTDKTKAMIFNAGMIDPPNLIFRNTAIEFVESHKYLGIHLQSNFQWDVHVNKILREIRSASKACSKIRHQLDGHIAVGMYQKLVYNRLSKMAAVYGLYATREQLDQLQDAQNDAITNIFAGGNDNDLNGLYARHKLLNVRQIINYDLAVLMYKYFENNLKLNRLIDAQPNGRNILNVGERYFQSLGPSLRNADNIEEFKTKFRARYFN